MMETGIIPKTRRAAHGDHRGYVLAMAQGRVIWKEQADRPRDTKEEAMRDARRMVGEYAPAYTDYLVKQAGEDTDYLLSQGWHTWYNPNCWVHPMTVTDPEQQDYTAHGRTRAEAVAFTEAGFQPRDPVIIAPERAKQ